MNGSGRVVVGDETFEIQTGDAVSMRLNKVHSFLSVGSTGLEMISGVSTQKNVLNTLLDSPGQPIWLQVSPRK